MTNKQTSSSVSNPLEQQQQNSHSHSQSTLDATLNTASTEKKKILVVEDEKDVRELILLLLERENQYELDSSENGEEALNKIKNNSYDLVILDWMLPGLSGLQICKEIKGQLPILILTARVSPDDIVLGLDSGADDYLTKPFEMNVLMARIKALLRRSNHQQNSLTHKLQMGELVVDFDAHKVFFGKNEIALTPSEFKLLSALATYKGRVLSRDKLIELVQGQGVAVIDRAIDTHVFGLRKKLGQAGQMIETIRGIGYRMEG